jgi:hypothetical protein
VLSEGFDSLVIHGWWTENVPEAAETAPVWEVLDLMPFFALTYTVGGRPRNRGRRVPRQRRSLPDVRSVPHPVSLWTVYTGIVRRLDRRAVLQVDEVTPAT